MQKVIFFAVYLHIQSEHAPSATDLIFQFS